MRIHRPLATILILAAGLALAGCRPASTPSGQPAEEQAEKQATRASAGNAGLPTGRKAKKADGDSKAPAKRANREIGDSGGKRDESARPPRRTLADLMEGPADATDRWMADERKVKVDDAQVAAAGIRRLDGRYLTLYTDLPSDALIDNLPTVFDLAFPQWCNYFEVDQTKMKDWKLTGFLIRDRELFRRLGLLPRRLPPFQYAFCVNTDFWIYEQPGEYYGRHLVLHEGTHCFMNRLFGACGPPWYMEGMAELLSTHRWADGRLTMNYVPRTSEEVPMLGRIKLVKDAMAAGRTLSLRQVLEFRPYVYVKTEPYAWSWAAALFLDRHPRWGDVFRKLRDQVLEPDLTEQFVAAVGDDWPALEQQWRVFLADLEYGCDPPKMLIDPTSGQAIAPGGAQIDVSAERGWQNSGLRVEKGKSYRLKAQGRYQVGDKPKIWWCEPGGVTIQYYRGRPLGMLLAAVLPDPAADSTEAGSPQPIPVGLETTLVPKDSGTLYFKINESSSDWGDNRGTLFG